MVFQGISDFLGGARSLLARPRLYPLVLAPFLLSALVLGLTIWLVYSQASPLMESMAAALPGFVASIAGGLLKIILIAGLALVAFFAFTAVSALITTPFCEMISESLETELTGIEPPPFSPAGFVRDLLMGIGHALRRVILYVVLVLAIMVVGALVPVIGWLIGGILSALVTIRFAAFDAMDTVMARKSWTYQDKRQYLSARRARTFGLGAATAGALLIPIFNLIAFPAASAGATLLYIDEERRQG